MDWMGLGCFLGCFSDVDGCELLVFGQVAVWGVISLVLVAWAWWIASLLHCLFCLS